MTKLNPFIKSLLLGFALIVNVGLSAQTIEYLNSNNVKAGIGIGGALFMNKDSFNLNSSNTSTADLFESPIGWGRDEIFVADLWMSGYDNHGNLHTAYNFYESYNGMPTDYFDGPVSSSYNSNYTNYYNRVFGVSESQINVFRILSFPVIAAQVDSSILYWPGKGNPSVLSDYGVSIDSPLAPFVDLNHNGIYEPLQGDYPAVAGNQNIYFVFNDIGNGSADTGRLPLGIEVRGMASTFSSTATNTPVTNGAIDNSIFIQYEIENKSQNIYTGFNLGLWSDPDIGCFDNDYVGCDSTRSLMFAYNGTIDDPSCAPELGYDSLPVALGIQCLNQPLAVFGGISGNLFLDSVSTEPMSNSGLELYFNALWQDSTPFEYGGTGYNSGGYPTKFMFSGDPTDTTQWSEVQAHTTPGDRRMYGSVGPTTFNPGEVKQFDLSFTSTYNITSNHVSIVDSLKRDADSVRAFYLHHIVPAQQVLSINEVAPSNQLTISIYPNPANDQVTIVAGDYIKSLQLMDIQGRVLLAQEANAKKLTLPVNNLAKGVYLLNIECATGTTVKKIVVE